MTLILSAVKKQFAVVSADGAEFRHNPGKPKFMEVKNRQKLFLLSGRSVVLAVHGQNRLTTIGEGLASQRLVGDILEGLDTELAQIPTVERITQKLIDLLTPDVTYTFQLLQSVGIHQSALGICVVGFDSDGGRSRGFEAYWPMLTDQSTPRMIKHILDEDEVRIIHSGTGTEYAKRVIDDPHHQYNPNRLKRASISETQKYVRGIYRDASTLQPKSSPEFGGNYHEVTITRDQSRWAIPPS